MPVPVVGWMNEAETCEAQSVNVVDVVTRCPLPRVDWLS